MIIYLFAVLTFVATSCDSEEVSKGKLQDSSSGNKKSIKSDINEELELIKVFYTEYINQCNNGGILIDVFEISETNEGYIEASIDRYKQELIKFSFSNQFIVKEIGKWNDCVRDLQRLEYNSYINDDIDISENCSNLYFYQWLRSQEVPDEVSVTKISDNDNEFKVTFSFVDSNGEKFNFGNYSIVKTKKIEGKVYIDSIDVLLN